MWPLELDFWCADLRLTLAQRRFARALEHWVRKYRADQPRAPAGTALGGQWIDADGALPVRQDNDRVRVAQVEGGVNLLDHEGVGGAHAIAEHVGKSDAYLLARVGGGAWRFGPKTVYRYRAGSFTSIDAANRLVNSTLALNHALVLSVARGIKPDAYLVAQFGSPTGKEAFRASQSSQPYIRTTTWVGVYIIHDSRFPSGFRVQTAFPLSE